MGRGRVREDRPHPAQHLGERAAGLHLAQFGAERVQLGRVLRHRHRQDAVLQVPLLLRDAVAAPQPEHQRAGGPLVADRQRVAQIHEDRVREGRHGRPAQTHDDLVQVDTAGDPTGRRAHEAQPVPVAPHRRGPARGQRLAGTAFVAALGRPLVRTARLDRDPFGDGPRPVRVRLRGGRLGVLGAGTGRVHAHVLVVAGPPGRAVAALDHGCRLRRGITGAGLNG